MAARGAEGHVPHGILPALRPRILVLIDYYLPGYRSGGALRSLANLIASLGDEFAFSVLTGDRDSGSEAPYSGIVPGKWQPVGKAMVRYLGRRERSLRHLARIIRETPHDILYFSSCFSARSTILPLILLRLGRIRSKAVILGPRGEFSLGALTVRFWKKKLYLRAAKALGLFRDVVWQASTELESDDIRREIGPDAKIIEAIDFSPSYDDWTRGVPHPTKQPGVARLCYVSRISEKKNLVFAIELLRGIQGSVEFDIYGPVDDAAYWVQCQAAMASLPPNVKITAHGPVPHDELGPLLARYDLFFFPTLGENFGHTIVEALAAGCPVLVSDQTPWLGLEEEGVGWDLPLSDAGAFQRAVESIVAMPEEQHAEMRRKARAYGLRAADPRDAVEQNRALFCNVLPH